MLVPELRGALPIERPPALTERELRMDLLREIVGGVPLGEWLEHVVRTVEKLAPTVTASVLLVEGSRLKVAAALAVFRSLYIMAGIDDALNAPGELPIITGNTPVPEYFSELKYGRDYFLGVGLRISDVDLTTMLRFYGAVIAANALAN